MLSKAPIFSILFVVAVSLSAQDMDEVQITESKISDNIYMLQGRGGNIGLCFGQQGIFIIDDQFAPLHEKIINKIKEITGKAPYNSNMYVINTHSHPDHTGGNELMGEAGAVIIAHKNVRKRLSTEQVSKFFNRTSPPLAESGLPVITFTSEITFHLNGDSVHVLHVPPAHTDGDAIVHFIKANVIHTGDLVFNGRYPIIDLERGGSVPGVINACKQIMELCNNETKVIPGHGNLTNKKGVEKFMTMLSTIYDRVKEMAIEGKSLEEVIKARPSAEFDSEFNNSVPDERFLGVVYKAAKDDC